MSCRAAVSCTVHEAAKRPLDVRTPSAPAWPTQGATWQEDLVVPDLRRKHKAKTREASATIPKIFRLLSLVPLHLHTLPAYS